jgi:hypothetical protein
VITDPRFTPNGGGVLPKLRNLYTSVASAVNKLLFEGCQAKGLAFIFPKDVVKSYITGFHGSPLGWTSKDQKESGRPIGDCSDGGKQPGNLPLNSDYTKDESNKLWGCIRHPTLADICKMISESQKQKSYS